MKVVRLVFFCVGIWCVEVYAQDALFSQYFASGQYFNPSLVATESAISVSGITRTQWKSVDAAGNVDYQNVTEWEKLDGNTIGEAD